MPPSSITQSHREALEKYMSNQIVFFQGGANFLNIIKENAPETYKNTAVTNQLIGTEGQFDFSLMNLVIPVKSDKKQEALKFALFLTNYKNQLELGRLTNVLATNRRALTNKFYATYDENDLISEARFLSARQIKYVSPVLRQLKNQKDVNLLINTAVQQILLNEDDTKVILDDVANKWAQILD